METKPGFRALTSAEAADLPCDVRAILIPISAEMVRAGASALEEWRGAAGDNQIVEEIYRAMRMAAS